METILFIQAALRLGYTFTQITERMVADGYVVPTMEEYESKTQELRDMPDLAKGGK